MRETGLARVGRGLPADALVGSVDDMGCALVSGAASPSRTAELERATKSLTAALGPVVPRGELGSSWALAKAALRAAEAGAIEGTSPVLVEEHLADLLIFESGGLADRLEQNRLAPLADLTPAGRARMEETALAFVQHGGNAAAMARALHLHPQTVRYRLTRLRELFGDQLEHPDERFELELALRSARSRRAAQAARS
jgi:DNA-binding PucR family transcriptional regulator